MLRGKCILAVVPARSGSKGIPHKNMRKLLGISLIGWAGRCLSKLPWLDGKIISTDSKEYAEEGKRYGLDVPFLRPAELSSDAAGAVETIIHALFEADRFYGKLFDVVLIVEPTSPLRTPDDIEKATKKLLNSEADSVVSVSSLNFKFHPAKVLSVKNDLIDFYEAYGALVVTRQTLKTLYWRNGVCYALRRESLIKKKRIITNNTMPLFIEREVVNIDEPIELVWAEMLMRRNNIDF